MLFIVDENSLGKLSCVLKCMVRPPIHDINDIKGLGFLGLSDPNLIQSLPSREIVIISRDGRMINSHRSDLLSRPNVSLLILKTDEKIEKRISWNGICGAVLRNWTNIQQTFEQQTKQCAFMLDLRRQPDLTTTLKPLVI